MNNLKLTNNEVKTISSLEVAEMVEKQHAHLMRDINTYTTYITANPELDSLDFFIESTYIDVQRKERRCYNITKKGCEFIAHKLTGQKGALFTASYINKFHDMEEQIKQPQLPQDYKQALQHLLIAVEKNEQLQLTLEQQKPKVIFADAVSATNDTILIRDLAKILKQNGIQIGGNELFEWLRNKGYLIKQKGTDHNRPTQKSMNLGLFKVKETAITHSDGRVTTSITTKVTGKGQQYFVNKFLKQQQIKCI
jgi:Rha family phage regulatory protein